MALAAFQDVERAAPWIGIARDRGGQSVESLGLGSQDLGDEGKLVGSVVESGRI